MKVTIYILLACLIWSIFRTQRTLRACKTEQQRTFAIRTTIAAWLLGFVFIAAMVFLPDKARVLMLLPAFFVTMSVARAWYNTRERLRREAQGRLDLESMKRVG